VKTKPMAETTDADQEKGSSDIRTRSVQYALRAIKLYQYLQKQKAEPGGLSASNIFALQRR